jgi:hypothetical protein
MLPARGPAETMWTQKQDSKKARFTKWTRRTVWRIGRLISAKFDRGSHKVLYGSIGPGQPQLVRCASFF